MAKGPEAALAEACDTLSPPTVTRPCVISALTRSRDRPLASANALSSRCPASSTPVMTLPSPMIGTWEMALRVTRVVLDAIRREAATAAPRECCGILLGQGETIETARPAANVADDPVRQF